ncbi:MAG: hypothetical protein LBU41_01710, partial [Clostridiales Family XIII bacterium]|nr:hypothetical protein [Clostridiales Family XIII bacterium]
GGTGDLNSLANWRYWTRSRGAASGVSGTMTGIGGGSGQFFGAAADATIIGYRPALWIRP